MSNNEQKPIPNPGLRWLKRAAIAILCLILAVAIPATILELVGRSALRQQILRMHEAGEPLTLAEFVAMRPPLDDKDNSYLVLQPLFPALDESYNAARASPTLPVLGRARLPAWNDLWPAEMVDALRSFVTEHEKVISDIDAVRTLPRGRPPFVLSGNPLVVTSADWSHRRHAAQLTAIGALGDVADGRIESAAGRCETMLNVGGSLIDEPYLISALVLATTDGLAIEALERVLAAGQASREVLLSIQNRLSDHENSRMFVNSLRGERLLIFGGLEFARTNGWDAFEGGVSSTTPMSAWQPAVSSLLSGLVRLNEAKVLELMDQPIRLAENPHKLMEAGREWDAGVKGLSSKYFLAKMVMPSIVRACVAAQTSIVESRCAQTALAAERFRLDQGHWPATLADLVPKYIDAVPLDPFDEKPLRYRIDPDKITIYSIAEDGLDNGGDLTTSPENILPPDTGFRLLNPDRRRFQIAPPEGSESEPRQ